MLCWTLNPTRSDTARAFLFFTRARLVLLLQIIIEFFNQLLAKSLFCDILFNM